MHAAKALGYADPFELLPPAYAWWLERREKTRVPAPPAAGNGASPHMKTG